MDCQSQSNPLNRIAITIEQSNPEHPGLEPIFSHLLIVPKGSFKYYVTLGGGSSKYCQTQFFCLLKHTVSNTFGRKTLCHKARYGFKIYFLFSSFNISKQFEPKNQPSKIEKCHTGGGGGGGKKVPKNCPLLFEWPLRPV